MKYNYIDMEKYPRIKHFEYFNNLSYPYVGITVNVEITNWLSVVKNQPYPFFLSFLYAISNAANAVPEFRQRIVDNKIIEFEKCFSSYTVALEDNTYCYCVVDAYKPLHEFLIYAKERQKKAIEDSTIDNEGESLPLFFVSSLPWLSYISIVQPVPMPADSNPRITWGKYFSQGEKVFIPVSVLCHHALVDGAHINQFYKKLKILLEEMFNDNQ